MEAPAAFSILALAVSVAGISWTVWFNLSKERSEKIDRTINLQFRFYQSDMVDAREVGWYLLERLEENETPLIFQSLWDNDNVKIRDEFNQLYKVMGFWLTVHQLGEEKKLDVRLASRMFTYEYDWWAWRLERLISDTMENSKDEADIPEVFQAFHNNGIGWLQRNTDNKPIQRTRKRAAD